MAEVSFKKIRGRECTVEAFAEKYNLRIDEAKRLYMRFGPSETDLDLLMVAKRRKETI